MTLPGSWLPALMAVSFAAAACTSVPGDAEVAGEVTSDISPGYVLFDRESGTVTAQLNEAKPFRSASLVKLLIALDYLNTQGSLDEVPNEDLAALESMLRSSNDVVTRDFWQEAGRTAVIDRMVPLLDLEHTHPSDDPDFWGYTAMSASDVVKTYQVLLNGDENGFGRFVIDNLHRSTQCSADGRDQYFGIPRAVPPPFAVKQGWSGFGETPSGEECVSDAASQPTVGKEVLADVTPRALRRATAPDVDLESPLLHSTGLVDDDRKIFVVLTLYPMQTSWSQATERITDLTKDIYRNN